MSSNKPDNQVVTDQCNVDAYSSLQADLKDATNVKSVMVLLVLVTSPEVGLDYGLQ